MVSSALDMELDELLRLLARLSAEHADDPEYQEVRRPLPADWPI